MVSRLIDATVGQIIFNQPIPQDLGFVDRTNPEQQFDLEITFKVGKKQLGDIVEPLYCEHMVLPLPLKYWIKSKPRAINIPPRVPSRLRFAMRLSHHRKQQYLEEADAQIEKITKQYRRGMMSNEERYNRVIETWNDTTKKVYRCADRLTWMSTIQSI